MSGADSSRQLFTAVGVADVAEGAGEQGRTTEAEDVVGGEVVQPVE